MRLYRRGDTWHYDFSVDGRRFRGSTGLRHKAAAAIKVGKLERAAKLGEDPSAATTLADAADQWFAAKQANKKTAKTTARRVTTMIRLMGADTPVADIGSREIAAAIAARRMEPTRQSAKSKTPRAPANATVNRDMIDSTLRPILRYAKRVMEAPVKDIAWDELRLDEPKERVRSFPADELAAWRRNLPPWHRPLHDFYRRYGLRLQEAFFPISDYEPQTGRVTVRERKNGRPHTIRLLPEDAALMTARIGRASAAKLNTAWFREMKDGSLRPIKWRGYQSASQEAIRRAGLSDARPTHDLRHHAATALLRATGNLAAAKRLLGHENIQSTMRYAHADDDDVTNALRHTYGTEAEAGPRKPKRINRQ